MILDDSSKKSRALIFEGDRLIGRNEHKKEENGPEVMSRPNCRDNSMCVRLACVRLLTICFVTACLAAGHSDANTAQQARPRPIRKRDLRVSLILSPRQPGLQRTRVDRGIDCQVFGNCTVTGETSPLTSASLRPVHLDVEGLADDEGELDDEVKPDGDLPTSHVWKHRGAFGDGMSTSKRTITFPKTHTHDPMLGDIRVRPTRQWKDLMQRGTPDSQPPSSHRRRAIVKRIVNERTVHLNTAPRRRPNRKTTDKPSPNSSLTCNCSYNISLPPWQSFLKFLFANGTGGLMKEIVRASMLKTIKIERVYGRNVTSCKCDCTQPLSEPSSAPGMPSALSTSPYDRTLPDMIMPRRRPLEPSEPPVVVPPVSTNATACPRRVYVQVPGNPLPVTAQECKKLWLSHYSSSDATYWDCEDTDSGKCRKNADLPFLGVVVSKNDPGTSSTTTRGATTTTQSTPKKACTKSTGCKMSGSNSKPLYTTDAKHPLNLHFPFYRRKAHSTITKLTTWSKVKHDHYPTTAMSRTSKGSRTTTTVAGCQDNSTPRTTTRMATKIRMSTLLVKLESKKIEQLRKLNASMFDDLRTMCQSRTTPSVRRGSSKKQCNNTTLSSRRKPLATVKAFQSSTIYSTKSSTKSSSPLITVADVSNSTGRNSPATSEVTSTAAASSTNESSHTTFHEHSRRHSHEFDDEEVLTLTTADLHRDRAPRSSTAEALAVPYRPAGNTTSYAYPYHEGRRGNQKSLQVANRETASSTEESRVEVRQHEALNGTTETYSTAKIIFGINPSSVSQRHLQARIQGLKRRHTEGAMHGAAASQADSDIPLQVSVLKSKINVNAMLTATKNVAVGSRDNADGFHNPVKSSAADDEYEYYYVYDDGTKVHV